MKLYRMTASFGCLQKESLTFEDGFHLITAPNERGKSTWCAFLLAMLYGINTRARAKAGMPAEKTRYRPWNGDALEGLLECDYQGRRMILRRGDLGNVPFGAVSARWADSGEVIPEMTADTLGELLTGVGRDVFERSLFFRQGSLLVDQSEELEQRILSLLSSGEESTSYTQADGLLREWLRRRRHHKNGELPQLEETLRDLSAQIQNVQALHATHQAAGQALKEAEEAVLRNRREDSLRHKQDHDEALQRLQEADLAVETARIHCRRLEERPPEEATVDDPQALDRRRRQTQTTRRLWSGLLWLPALSGAALLLLRPSWFPSFGGWCLILAALLGEACVFLWAKAKAQEYQAEGLAVKTRQRRMEEAKRRHEEDCRLAQEALQRAQELALALAREVEREGSASEDLRLAEQARGNAQQELARLTGRLQELGDLRSLEAEYAQTLRRRADRLAEYAALELAIDALKTADRDLRERFAPSLNQLAGTYFANLTQGRYDSLILEKDFTAQVSQVGSTTLRKGAVLSRGTLDQLYVALRLAICQLVLPPDNHLPLILDDALVAFDDERARQGLHLLREIAKDRQVLFFTCQNRERQLLEGEKDVHYISLP